MIRYARAADGTHLAFDVRGTGPALLLVSNGFIPVDTMDEEPSLRACLDRLATTCTLVRFDRRGVGLSDPPPPSRPLQVEHWAEDAVAVLDAAGVRTAFVLASTENSGIGLLLAALHPGRVDGVVLVHASARGLVGDDYPIGFPAEVLEALAEATTAVEDAGLGTGALAVNAPSTAGDPAFEDWFRRAGRRGASPAVARRLMHLTLMSDVRWTLPRIACPLLVLHRAGDQMVPLSHGRYIADAVQGARLVLLPGGDGLWWVGDTGPLLDEVERFVAEHAGTPVSPVPGVREPVPAAPVPAEDVTGLGSEVIATVFRRHEAQRTLAVLTAREREILDLMALGDSNARICERLRLSPKTVETHIGSIFRKLGLTYDDDVDRRVAAVVRRLGQ